MLLSQSRIFGAKGGSGGGSLFLSMMAAATWMCQVLSVFHLQPLLCDSFSLSPSSSSASFTSKLVVLYGSSSLDDDDDDIQQQHQFGYTQPSMNRRSALVTTASSASSLLFLSSFPSTTTMRGSNAANAATVSDTSNNDVVSTTWTLDSSHNNIVVPKVALNTVGLSIDETELAIKLAISNEMTTHVDFHPGNERDGVAKYLKNHPKKDIRSKLFLNTKIRKAKPGTSAEDAAKQTKQQIDNDLKALNVPYVDMLMVRYSTVQSVCVFVCACL